MEDNKYLNDIDKKIILGDQWHLFDDPLGRSFRTLHKHGILDPWAIEQINHRVEKAGRKRAFDNRVFREPQLNDGELLLGMDPVSQQCLRAPVQYLNGGSLLIGNTGCAKTATLCFYANQAAGYAKVWLVDLRKKEFRRLKRSFAERGLDLIIIRARKFKINPLQVPDGVVPNEHASTISDVFQHVFNLPPRASVLLRSTIIKLYKKFKVMQGGNRYPTLFHLFEEVRNTKNANAQARQAILDNLEAELLSLGTEVLGYYRGWDISQLAKRHIVFELTGLSEMGKDLVLNYIVVSEFMSRIAKGISNQGMDLLLCTDESQRLFSQRRELSGHSGNSLTDLAGLIRGAGLGLFVSALTPDDLSHKIPSITSTKIMGRCGSFGEYIAAGRYLGLTRDEIFFCMHNMRPGMFACQMGDGGWRYPFLFQVPKIKPQPAVSDAVADETLKYLESLDVEPVEFSRWSAVPKIEVVDSAGDDIDLTESELRLLKAVVENPMQPSSSYVKLASISPNTLSKLRPIFIARGFIREHVMDATKGRSKKLWEPLDAAKKIIEKINEGDF